MTILGPAEIARLLPMGRAVDAMRSAFVAHAQRRVLSPPRSVLATGGKRGATLVMPAALDQGDDPVLVVKVVSVFPENSRAGLPNIHGTVLVVDANTGAPEAILDGTSLTAIRTAATCGLATDLLARKESTVLAVFGSGVHARTQVRAMCAVRSIRAVRIFNPNMASARKMAKQLLDSPDFPDDVRAAGSSGEALDGTDIACMATTSVVPVFKDQELPAGVHLNAIGSFKPGEREVPGATAARARIVVDDVEAALEEAGDLLIPISEGLFSESHIACALGDLALGRGAGRAADDEISFFKSVGLAVQDVFAAQAVLREARRLQVGRRIEWQAEPS